MGFLVAGRGGGSDGGGNGAGLGRRGVAMMYTTEMMQNKPINKQINTQINKMQVMSLANKYPSGHKLLTLLIIATKRERERQRQRQSERDRESEEMVLTHRFLP